MSARTLFDLDGVRRDAVFSSDRVYRYSLTRVWEAPGADTLNRLVVIGLNPSTADETKDDATIRRVIHFARAWGHDGFFMLNVFAFRASVPTVMRDAQARGVDVVGPENDLYIESFTRGRRVLCAWGSTVASFGHHSFWLRTEIVYERLAHAGRELVCLGTTREGFPVHPMARGKHRVPDDAKPVPFAGRL